MKIILASKSGVRKKILDDYKIDSDVVLSNVDEDEVKTSLLAEGANPLLISKNLAEIKSVKVSSKNPDRLVLGADSVISLNNELINKPRSRDEALKILKKLNNSKHYLISSVCFSKNNVFLHKSVVAQIWCLFSCSVGREPNFLCELLQSVAICGKCCPQFEGYEIP